MISYIPRIGPVILCAVFAVGCTESQFEERTINTTDLTRVDNPDARIEILKSTLSQNPTDLSALKALGAEYSKQALWSEAASSYREALILKSSDREASIGYSKALSASGRFAPALSEAQKAISVRPGVDAYVAAGIAQDGLGRQAEAQALYTKALSENKRDLDVRSNIALSKAMQGDQAAYSLMSGVALAPDADSRHKSNMVLVCALLGRMDDAKAYGSKFGISKRDVNEIFKIAARARVEGTSAFGLARAN